MKYYLLIAGDHHYPRDGTEDWIGCFESFKDAKSQISEKYLFRKITKGENKGKEEIYHTQYDIGDKTYDWYTIVDLRDWIERQSHELDN